MKVEWPVIVTSLDVVFSVDENIILPEFLLNYLLSNDWMYQILSYRQWIEWTWRKNLPYDKFSKVVVPVPSIEEQKDIIMKLKIFENYIFEWLSSEIKLRQQQYEYYRDKLLAFK